MSKVLIFDTECNSLDLIGGFIQELAWGIFDTESKRFISAQCYILKWPRPYNVELEAYHITGLSYEYCQEYGSPADATFLLFEAAATKADFICGHNAIGYDIPMFISNFSRILFTPTLIQKSKVIDTLLDCPFPAKMKQHSLKYLALDHGYVLTGAHQALNDVYACAHILSCYDFEEVRKIAATPVVTLTAKIDFNDIESRDRIKNARFYWNPKRKLWEKRIREYHLPGIQLSLGDTIKLYPDANP